MSVNKVILLGNVGQPPKVTYYDGGNCVAQVSFATSEKGYTLQNGTQIPDRTEWHNLVFRNRLAEIVDQYVHKGDKLYVEGKYGLVRTMIRPVQNEIFVDNMEMLSPRNAASGTAVQAGMPGQAGIPVQSTQSQVAPAQNNPTDDLPF